MDLGLTNAAVLVTGGSGGIGRATALAFAAEGARVAFTYNSREDVAKTVSDEIVEAGGEAFAVPMSLNSIESVEAGVEAVVRHWGGLDVLVANAVDWGGGDFEERATRIEDSPTDDWQRMLRANLEGNFALVRAAAPALRGSAQGRVVLISSNVAEHGFPGSWSYGAAKAGLHGLTVSLTPDLGRDGILVNVVMPGLTLVDGHHQVVPDEALSQIAAQFPAGRLPSTEDVAAAIAFFGSPRNGGTTGEIVRVTGGTPVMA
jgi:NAD(P)-dependent dehydrogenase (short-subunit alcohol dehydrogenase family)